MRLTMENKEVTMDKVLRLFGAGLLFIFGVIVVVFEILAVNGHGFKGDARGVIVFFMALGVVMVAFSIRIAYKTFRKD